MTTRAMIETMRPIDFGPLFGMRYISEIRKSRPGDVFMAGYLETLILPFDWNPVGHMERDGEWLGLWRDARALGGYTFPLVEEPVEWDGYTVPLFAAVPE